MDQTVSMHAPVESSELMGTSRGKLGMWLFLASDAITFGALLAAYGAMRMGSADWPVPSTVLDVPLTALNTFILICSSVTMVQALSAVRQGNAERFQTFLLLTIAGGAVFLGIQAYEWTHLIVHQGLRLRSSLFASTFFSLTGFHGAHVFAGVVYLLVIFFQARAGVYTADRNERVEIAGLYWHFVDLVWILVFTFVYLL
jgi:heme/copper-type cytochrome/quinol oxidase subunit 3